MEAGILDIMLSKHVKHMSPTYLLDSIFSIHSDYNNVCHFGSEGKFETWLKETSCEKTNRQIIIVKLERKFIVSRKNIPFFK